MAKAGPGQSWEPGPSSRPPGQVAGDQALVSSAAANLRSVPGSPSGSGEARTQTCPHGILASQAMTTHNRTPVRRAASCVISRNQAHLNLIVNIHFKCSQSLAKINTLNLIHGTTVLQIMSFGFKFVEMGRRSSDTEEESRSKRKKKHRRRSSSSSSSDSRTYSRKKGGRKSRSKSRSWSRDRQPRSHSYDRR